MQIFHPCAELILAVQMMPHEALFTLDHDVNVLYTAGYGKYLQIIMLEAYRFLCFEISGRLWSAATPDEYLHFLDYLERLACREDGWHSNSSIKEYYNLFLISRQPAPANFYSTISMRGVVHSSASVLWPCNPSLCMRGTG